MTFNNDTSFVIARDRQLGCFCRVNPDGSQTAMQQYSAEMLAGDVANRIRRLHPELHVGILSASIGPIVWLNRHCN